MRWVCTRLRKEQIKEEKERTIMKKLLVSVWVMVGLLTATAQNFESQNLLSVSSICVSNTINVTNILSASVGAGTNVDGTIWTNLAGVRVIAATTTSTNSISGVITTNASKVNLFKDISLAALVDREGRFPALAWAATNTLQNWQQSPASLFVKLNGQSGANSAVTFVLTPVPDGVNESTAAADLWSFSVTATTTTPVTLLTNLPLYKWMGCKTLRLRSVTNGDTDATSRVDILALSVNSNVP